MAAFIHTLTTAVPAAALTTERAAVLLQELCPDARTARRLAKIIPYTGIERRFLAVMETQADFDDPDSLYLKAVKQPQGPGMNARSLAFHAAADRLLTRIFANVPRADMKAVQRLITVSCTHASSPGLERVVFERTATRHDIDRWNLGFMGCSAALAALRLACQGTCASTLVVTCEISSLHFQYSADLEQLTANLLFGDGAAAVLVGDRPSPVRIVQGGCLALPEHADQMLWWAGDFGLRLSLSPELPVTLAAHLRSAVHGFLAKAGISESQVDHWLIHPGGPQILDAVQESLHLGEDALNLSRLVLRRFGNMSSPTILFILRAALEAGCEGRAMLIAFGPGLTVEMVLVEIEHSAKEILSGPSTTGDDA